jgi:hypothetical protein
VKTLGESTKDLSAEFRTNLVHGGFVMRVELDVRIYIPADLDRAVPFLEELLALMQKYSDGANAAIASALEELKARQSQFRLAGLQRGDE